MTGETSLVKLLQSLAPVLHPGIFVFCTRDPRDLNSLECQPIGLFYEAEGMTLILPQATAIALGWPYTYPCRQITLTVQSSLEAVGFLAAITQVLAAQGISVNPVSAYHHDHLFVPVDQAELAIACLDTLAAAAAED